jgi:MoaA/NifB/PqqE/SkfB family radical SAM enzyme
VIERLVVVWRVTTRCNLGCGFCAYDRALQFARHDASELTARALGQALAEERRQSGRTIHVSFLGGEPWLWPLLPQVARDYAALGLSLGITSNGTGLKQPAALELLLDCFDELTLSLDGLPATHNRLRAWPRGHEQVFGALERLLEARRRRARPLRVRVNTVLMRDNVAEFGELCRSLARLGVDEVSLNRLGGRDRPDFFAQHRLGAADLAELMRELPALRRELSPRGLCIVGSDAYLERLVSLERGERASLAACNPGQTFLFVDEHGQVAPCSFTLPEYGEPVQAGMTATALSRSFSLRQCSRRAAACDDCQSTHVFGKFRGA